MDAWDDLVVVGRVARTHGRHGQVIVNPETDFVEERYHPGATLYLCRDGRVEARRIVEMRVHLGRPIIGLDGIETMTEAEAIAGAELRVPVDDLARLPPGTYYRHDLVGCVVATTRGERVGSVRAVEGDLGASRLVVAGPNGEVLIPLAVAICVDIDIAGRRIVVDPPDGLLDLNARP